MNVRPVHASTESARTKSTATPASAPLDGPVSSVARTLTSACRILVNTGLVTMDTTAGAASAVLDTPETSARQTSMSARRILAHTVDNAKTKSTATSADVHQDTRDPTARQMLTNASRILVITERVRITKTDLNVSANPDGLASSVT